MTVAGVATIPGRERALAAMMESVHGQFDRIEVITNHPDNGSIQDGEKFRPFATLTEPSYCFVLDDDIAYPPDYVERTITHIERLKRRAVVCYAGKRYDHTPVKSFYTGFSQLVHLLTHDVDGDMAIHIPITSATAWHSDTIRFDVDKWDAPFMADVWCGCECHDKGVPIVCVPHRAAEFKNLMPLCDNPVGTIFRQQRGRDEIQTSKINERQWRSAS